MIDPVLLRENPDLLKRSQKARGDSVEAVDEALAADAERRALITSFEALRAEQNLFGKTVAAAAKDEKKALVAEAQSLAARVKAAGVTAAEAEARFGSVVKT
ncbi:MAG: serine--tRNA ligase, partial [Cryobacterium sp.]